MSRESCADFVIVAQPKRSPTAQPCSTPILVFLSTIQKRREKIVHRINIFFSHVVILYFYSVFFFLMAASNFKYIGLMVIRFTFAAMIFYCKSFKNDRLVANKTRCFVRKKILLRGINFLVCDASAVYFNSKTSHDIVDFGFSHAIVDIFSPMCDTRPVITVTRPQLYTHYELFPLYTLVVLFNFLLSALLRAFREIFLEMRISQIINLQYPVNCCREER